MPRHPYHHRLPPGLLPEAFFTQYALAGRRYVEGLTNLTPAHPWAPMTDAEWAVMRRFLLQHRCGMAEAPRAGRPLADPRARLDAIFRAVTLKRPWSKGGGRAPWTQLPEAFGKSDTISRTYRRWCGRDLWMRLLMEVAAEDCPPALAGLRWRICCAFRRGFRQMGMRGIVLARRLKLYSALPALSHHLPDPDLSGIYVPALVAIARYAVANRGWWPGPGILGLMKRLHREMGGRSRLTPAMEPP